MTDQSTDDTNTLLGGVFGWDWITWVGMGAVVTLVLIASITESWILIGVSIAALIAWAHLDTIRSLQADTELSEDGDQV